MEKLSLGVLNAEASEEGKAALEQAVSFLWAHGSCVSERSPAQLSREQKLTNHMTLWNLECGSDALLALQSHGTQPQDPLNCCPLAVKGEDTGQLSREEAYRYWLDNSTLNPLSLGIHRKWFKSEPAFGFQKCMQHTGSVL